MHIREGSDKFERNEHNIIMYGIVRMGEEDDRYVIMRNKIAGIFC